MSSTGAKQLTILGLLAGVRVFTNTPSRYSDTSERLGIFACSQSLGSTPR